MDEERIIAEQCSMLIYVVDGMMPQRELAKQARNYKSERWLPVVFSTVEGRE